MKKLKRLLKNYAKTNWNNLVTTKHNIDAYKLYLSTYRDGETDNGNNALNKYKKNETSKVEKSSNSVYFRKNNDVRKSQFGLLIHKDAIELPAKHSIWYELPVKAGQTLIISAATQYSNMENVTDRKAVLMINSYDEEGKEVNFSYSKMVRSENLHAYFKYLPSTNNSIKELHSFIVPIGVSYIQLGLRAFNTIADQKVFVKSLSVKPEFDEYQNLESSNSSATKKELKLPVEPELPIGNETTNDEQLFQEINNIEKVQFGSLVYDNAVELCEKEATWHELSVQPGQILVIKAASQYVNMENIIDRRAALIINSYNENGQEVDIPCGRMSKSSVLNAYFKYLPSTNNLIKELHSFIVPDGVNKIRFGICAFNTSNEQKVFIKNLVIESVGDKTHAIKSSNLLAIKKEAESIIKHDKAQQIPVVHTSKQKNTVSADKTNSKKVEFGFLIHKDAIELPQEKSICYELQVEAGQVLTINAASQYLYMENIVDRKAVLTINSYDKDGQEVDIPCGRMAKSKVLDAYFKYLPSTNNLNKEIHSFVVPVGVSQIYLGLRAFNINKDEKVFVKNFSIEPKLERSHNTKFISPSKQAAEVSIIGWPEIPVNDKPCVIGIMDEFTTGCFEHDINLIQPRPDNWFALAEKYKPVLFFIESAWQGNYGSWQYRVGQYANKPGNEIDHICQYARDKGIPTLFWNKEDPVHHDKFMCSAKLVDHIYTTDANMKASYTTKTGNTNVHSLPFAAQPALHKPAALLGRKPRSCFAGSWYGNRHAERGETMGWLLQAANNYGLDIYDRNYESGTFPFPEEYQAGIKGSLPYKELCEEYNRYRVFLNVNSVTESPTMFSRRVFELMASGTPVVSTYAKGIEALFDSDAVWLVNNKQEADFAIQTLMTDDAEWRRRSLAGIREIFSKHTYAHRLNSIFADMNLANRIEIDPNTVLFAKAHSLAEINLLKQFAKDQSYHKFCLVIEYAQNKTSIEHKEDENIVIIESGESKKWAIENQTNYSIAGWVTSNNYYGEHYIRDLVNASIYEPEAEGWAKALKDDVFDYGAPALLSGTLWKMNGFLDYCIDTGADEVVTNPKVYLADSDQFEKNVVAKHDMLRGKE